MASMRRAPGLALSLQSGRTSVLHQFVVADSGALRKYPGCYSYAGHALMQAWAAASALM